MPKKKTTESLALVPVGQTKTYPIANTAVQAAQIFHVPERHPRGEGPWQYEADKLAWTDAASSLPCTILRDANGTLGGYVGVTEEHPLFGFSVDAVPGTLGISPHGGLSFAEQCEDGPEETSVCHPSDLLDRGKRRPGRRDAESNGEHRPLWWFGFQCDRNHDLVPGQRGVRDIGIENGLVYRDEAYVYGQVTKLAQQLKSLTSSSENSGVPLDLSTFSPPVGLDPETRR